MRVLSRRIQAKKHDRKAVAVTGVTALVKVATFSLYWAKMD
jgi:hypothetical protein